jgi:hypothetical protein
MTFCGPARDTVLTNRQTEKLNFDTNYITIIFDDSNICGIKCCNVISDAHCKCVNETASAAYLVHAFFPLAFHVDFQLANYQFRVLYIQLHTH